MKAIWNDVVIAEANKNDLIFIEQCWYFPPSSIKQEYLKLSDTPYTCPWKGVCQYFNISDDNISSPDAAWSYPDPLPGSLEIIKKDYANYVAFWREVEVKE